MQRDSIENYYSDYITGDLDAALKISVENHLKASPDASAEIDALRLTMATLDEMPSAETPAWFHDNLMNRLDMAMENEAAQQQKAGWTWRELFKPRAFARGAAALAALLVIGGVGSQMAGINPLGFLMTNSAWARSKAMKGAADSAKVRAEWRPDGNGTALVHLTVPQSFVADSMMMGYTLESHGSKINEQKSGSLIPGQEQVVTIGCENPPAGNLTITIRAADDHNSRLETTKPLTFSAP